MNSIQEEMKNKFLQLSSNKPLGIDFTSIDPKILFTEVQSLNQLRDRFIRFRQIFRELEGLKEFLVPYYKDHLEELIAFRNAITYNELIQIQVFYEFIKGIEADIIDPPQNLKLIITSINSKRINKIRNSISHFDWKLVNKKIIFKDKNFSRTEDYYEVSEFCSLISVIAIFMTNDISKIP